MVRTVFVVALAILLSAAPVAAQTCVNTTELLAWWRADGSTADATGVRHGAFVGTERYEAGVSGQAFSFDGASYVAVPHEGAFTGNQGLTVAAWIKWSPEWGFLSPIMKMPGLDNNSGFAFEMFGASAGLYVALEANEFGGPGWRPAASAFISQDVWTHLTGTFDGSTIRFYVNGQLADSTAAPGNLRAAAGELHIGHDPFSSDRFVTGPIDEAVAFGRALSGAEVTSLYQGALAACPLDARERALIVWNPAAVTTMTPLDSSHLNATSPVPGRFEYSPVAGTLLQQTTLPAGLTTLVATFIPDDQGRYQTTKAYRQVSVAWQDLTTERSAPVITNRVSAVGGSGTGLAVDASRDRVWAVSRARRAVVILDGKTGLEIAAIPVSARFSGDPAVDAVRGHVYVPDAEGVRVFDAQTFAEITRFGISDAITALFVDATGDRLYVALGGLYRLDAFSLPIASANPAPVFSLDLVDFSTLIASDPVQQILYAHGTDLVAIDIDPQRSTFGSVLWRQSPNAPVAALAVNPRAGLVYVGEGGEALGVQVADGRRGSPTFGTFLTPFRVPGDSGVFRAVSGLAVHPVTNVVYAQLGDVGGSGSEAMVELIGLDATSGALLSEVWLEPAQVDLRRNFAGGRLGINTTTNRLYVVADFDFLSIIQDRYQVSRVVPDDGTTSAVTVTTSSAQVTFSDVIAGGALNVTSFDVSGAAIPAAGQFKLNEAIGFEISTTATATAPFQVCLNASHVTDPAAFGALSLLHAETVGAVYQWVDRTVSRDFATGMVCGETSSLSPFAVAQRIGPRYAVTAVDDLSRLRQVGSTIPVKVRVLEGSMNVSSATLSLMAVEVINLQTRVTSTPADAGASNRSGIFRFDESSRSYIFNLSTRALAPGPYELRVRVGSEPATLAVRFEVR
jgi:hypothetical protein